MKLPILEIIPRAFCRRAYIVTATIFLRALLNFVGLAMLLPVLVLVLNTDVIRTNRYFVAAYDLFGFRSDAAFIVALCATVVCVIVIKCLLNLALYNVERNYIYDLYRYLSRRLYIEYHNRELSFIKRSNSAVLSRNINVVCLTFVAGVLMPIASIASETMLFVMLFTALTLFNPLVALLTLGIFMPSVIVYYRLVRNRLNRYGEAENAAHREKARCVIETFRGYTDIEINNAFPSMLQRFDTAMDEVIRARRRNATISTLPSMFTEIMLCVGLVALIIINLRLESDQIKIIFGVFAVAALRLMPSVRNIMSAWTSLRFNRYTIEVIRDADIENADCTVNDDNRRATFTHGIEVRGLTFRYDDGQGDVISNLSLKIEKGEHVGIRGASGAGKTTLFNLLLGFYKPTAGQILIDGKPLDDTLRRAWQNTIGYVSQSVFLADGTLLDNIALGQEPSQIDTYRVEQALQAAKLKEYVDSLPHGVRTKIGEGGCRLSGGQRQRIGIARALYKGVDVLFFDEATSSLDSTTEEQINHSIAELSASNKELTIIVIAHRESSLEYCQRIITIQ